MGRSLLAIFRIDNFFFVTETPHRLALIPLAVADFSRKINYSLRPVEF